jgi:predicted ATPase
MAHRDQDAPGRSAPRPSTRCPHAGAVPFLRPWRDQGKVRQARELVAPVCGWFTEGLDTRDLKEAKALLEELAV